MVFGITHVSRDDLYVIQKLDLFEASYYHDVRRWGYFSILYRDNLNGKPSVRQESFPLGRMHEVIPLLGFPKRRDYYISQAGFSRKNRRAVNLAAIGVLFVGLDYYAIPSLQFMNRYRALPYRAGMLWKTCLSGLSRIWTWIVKSATLAGFSGSCTRSIRRTGSESRSPMWNGVARPEAIKYAFDDLEKVILPFSREQVSESRKHEVQLRLIDKGNLWGWTSRFWH